MQINWEALTLLLLLLASIVHSYNVARMRYEDFEGDERSEADAAADEEEEELDREQQYSYRSTISPPSCKVGPSYAAKAAQVATAANDAQSNAAECAAKQVRIQLAEKAIQACRAVEAVLESKRTFVDKVQSELNAADSFVQKLGASVQATGATAKKSECAAKAAESQFNHIVDMEQMISHSLSELNSLNTLAQTDFHEKRQMLSAAKGRGDRLLKQVECARTEYEQIKVDAYQAACAAIEARQKVNDAIAASSSGSRADYDHGRKYRALRCFRDRQRKRFINGKF